MYERRLEYNHPSLLLYLFLPIILFSILSNTSSKTFIFVVFLIIFTKKGVINQTRIQIESIYAMSFPTIF